MPTSRRSAGSWLHPGDNLAIRHGVADPNQPLDHPTVETKGEAGLVLGAHLACQRDGLALRVALDGDRADGPRVGRGRAFCATGKRRENKGGAHYVRTARPGARAT